MTCLGADVVIDYQTENICDRGERFDFILDLWATRSVPQNAALLTPKGRYVMVGGTKKTLLSTVFLGPIWGLVSGTRIRLLSVPPNLAAANRVAELRHRGELEICIDRSFALSDVRQALSDVRQALSWHGEGCALGKVVVTP